MTFTWPIKIKLLYTDYIRRSVYPFIQDICSQVIYREQVLHQPHSHLHTTLLKSSRADSIRLGLLHVLVTTPACVITWANQH